MMPRISRVYASCAMIRRERRRAERVDYVAGNPAGQRAIKAGRGPGAVSPYSSLQNQTMQAQKRSKQETA